ncbi:hypothetical protein SFC52_21300 [Niallia circulans]|uniref:hypothetical protein n=1 Tax=Niallia circulans TaxID=1397 RepID=UPI00398204E9
MIKCLDQSFARVLEHTIFSYGIYRQHFGTIGQLRKRFGSIIQTKRAKLIITKKDCEKN